MYLCDINGLIIIKKKDGFYSLFLKLEVKI